MSDQRKEENDRTGNTITQMIRTENRPLTIKRTPRCFSRHILTNLSIISVLPLTTETGRVRCTKMVDMMWWSDGTDGEQCAGGDRYGRPVGAGVVPVSASSLYGGGPSDSRARDRAHLLSGGGGGGGGLALSPALDVMPALVARPVSAELQLARGAVVVGRRAAAGRPSLAVELPGALAQQPATHARRPAHDVARPVSASLHDPLHRRLAPGDGGGGGGVRRRWCGCGRVVGGPLLHGAGGTRRRPHGRSGHDHFVGGPSLLVAGAARLLGGRVVGGPPLIGELLREKVLLQRDRVLQVGRVGVHESTYRAYTSCSVGRSAATPSTGTPSSLFHARCRAPPPAVEPESSRRSRSL